MSEPKIVIELSGPNWTMTRFDDGSWRMNGPPPKTAEGKVACKEAGIVVANYIVYADSIQEIA